MQKSSTDRIEKHIELNVPVARVWRALTDYKEFGAWFQVDLGAPFVPGETTRGRITYPGCEHMVMEVVVQDLVPERLFSFRWHPCDVEPNADGPREPSTLVEFKLEAVGRGTLLRLSESGFDAISPGRRDEAWRRNDSGWTSQMKNIEAHVTSSA